MTLIEVREQSWANASAIGFPVNPALPLLDDGMTLREPDDITARALALHAVVACSYGFGRDAAVAWLENEQLLDVLSNAERSFLSEGIGSPERFQDQVEGLHAFAWMLRLSDEMNFTSRCGDALVRLFPNLKIRESASQFVTKSNLRNLQEILKVCDLAYCLHWGARQLLLENKTLPYGLEEYVIAERRRAFEWTLCEVDWDEISLDT